MNRITNSTVMETRIIQNSTIAPNIVTVPMDLKKTNRINLKLRLYKVLALKEIRSQIFKLRNNVHNLIKITGKIRIIKMKILFF